MHNWHRRVRYWTLALSLLLLFNLVRLIPFVIEERKILLNRVETMARLTTGEPDEKGFVYYAYDTVEEPTVDITNQRIRACRI
jgi:hypothetical protein